MCWQFAVSVHHLGLHASRVCNIRLLVLLPYHPQGARNRGKGPNLARKLFLETSHTVQDTIFKVVSCTLYETVLTRVNICFLKILFRCTYLACITTRDIPSNTTSQDVFLPFFVNKQCFSWSNTSL